ncbi:MAG: undecaprenyl-phosphate glucose phosphotransferase [Nitrospinae bacterium]|nr:undecaprenyl-phosphate glucose phosphotransferase [Nitrospinota bacterium]
MLKKYAQLFLTALYFGDSLMILLSLLAAYYLRFHFGILPVDKGVPPIENFYWYALVAWAVLMLNFKVCGLYLPLRGKSLWKEHFTIIKATTLSLLIFSALLFFYREDSYSRAMTLLFFGLATLMIMGSRIVIRQILMMLRRRGKNLRYVLIVGFNDLGQELARRIEQHPEMGLKIVGFLDDPPTKLEPWMKSYSFLGRTHEVNHFIEAYRVDQLYICLDLDDGSKKLEQIMVRLRGSTVDVKLVPNLINYMHLNGGVDELDGLPIIRLTATRIYGWNSVTKRTLDIFVSGLGIIITFPFMLLTALLIKLESPGKILYEQERMGLDKRKFKMLKFRSMHQDAERDTGPVWAARNDARRTRVGAFLRKTSIDELPQLFNVLKGEMSMVGPRPERPMFIQEFNEKIPQYAYRMKMKAGMTGWAQIHGWRGNTSLERRIEHDLYYINNWSPGLDIEIMATTLWKGLMHKNAN